MKNEISNVLNLIESGDTYKALQNAKSFYEKIKNNIDAIKLLAYSNIQIGNFEKVIECSREVMIKIKTQEILTILLTWDTHYRKLKNMMSLFQMKLHQT